MTEDDHKNACEKTSEMTFSTSSPTPEYQVGNKRPPLHSQFRKGQSGNPKGRPPKSQNFQTDLREELFESVRIRQGDRLRNISKQRALLKALVNRGLSGDVRAITTVFNQVARLVDDDLPASEDQKLDANDAAILDDFVARQIAIQGHSGTSSDGDEK